MNKAPISVVIPTYNEEETIGYLLEKLSTQSLQPDEIIISDGNSSDKTESIINSYKINNDSIAFVNRTGNCRGSGRNEGIEKASNNIIALIDSGIYPDRDWLKELYSSYLEDENKVIFGSVRPLINSRFKRALGSFIVGKINGESIIPSVGSMLFHKDVWKRVGKFKESPEGKYVVEDLDFIEKIKVNGYESIFNLNSSSDWEISKDYSETYKRFSNYSRGTFENGLFRTWHLGVFRNSFIYLSFLFLSFSLSKLLLIGIVLFHFLRVISYLRKTKWYLLASLSEKVIDFYYLTFILVIIDFSTYKGIFDSFLKTTKTY